LLNEAGISEYHREHDEVSGEMRLANLQELVNGAALYEASPEGLADFLEHIALNRAKARIVGKPPYGFAPAQHASSREVSGAAAKRKTSSDGRWQLGDRVFNEDRGYGEITAIDEEDEGPVITVQYENGRRQRFLSRAQSSRFIKIRE
jgi:hypothetical protein